MSALRATSGQLLTGSVASLAWAVVLFVRPSDETSTLSRLIGVGLVILGLSFLVRASTSRTPRADRLDGFVWLVVGVGAVVWPDPRVRSVAIAVGVGLVVTGLVELVSAVRNRADERLLLALGGLSSVGFGVAALVWPTVTTLVISVVVAARLVIAAADLLARRLRTDDDGAVDPAPGRWRRGLRIGMGLVGVLAAAGAATVSVFVHRAQPGALSSFYDDPDELPGGPGTLIRQELVDPFIDGATAYRVLYVTSDTFGAPTTSSGLVIVPDGEAPVDGRPVMAFTHGTVGIARECALSALPGDRYGPAIPGIREMLDAGFVVAATDYAGLGSEGTAAYLVGAAQAYAAIDNVRVAVALPEAEASNRFLSFGESQGGQASLFTGQYAAVYAPELELVGSAAAAPATDLRSLFQANVGTTFGDVLASYALASWDDVYGARIDEIATPQAVPVIERLAGACIQNTGQMLSVLPEAELLKIDFLASPPWDTEPWATLLRDNTPGNTIVSAPVLIAQGADDPLVKPDVQQAFVDGWCERGQALEYRVYDGVGHLDAGHASAADVVAWAEGLLAGETWQRTC